MLFNPQIQNIVAVVIKYLTAFNCIIGKQNNSITNVVLIRMQIVTNSDKVRIKFILTHPFPFMDDFHC